MKQLQIIIVLLFLLIACQMTDRKDGRHAASSASPVDSSQPVAPVELQVSNFPINLQADSIPYPQLLVQIAQKRQQLLSAWQNQQIDLDSIGNYFETTLVQKVMPYWYGMPWSFEGHSSIPQQGEIACGYLVSTSLKQMGMNLNRYKLAQQYPELEARSIAIDSSFYQQTNFEGLFKLEGGLYFVGLGTSHVGFLWKKYKNLFFIHANYNAPEGVMIEPARQSLVLAGYENYHVAAISANSTFLRNWLEQKPIKIQTTF